ncbi:MAG: phosphatidate cytidylyltransferase [Rickettsiaceae bacterium]
MNIHQESEHLENKKSTSNLKRRILSSLFIGPIFILSILFAPIIFTIIMICVCIAMCSEWHKLVKNYSELILGDILILFATLSLILTEIYYNQTNLLLLYFIMIWSVDTFAMVGGKMIGGPKLAPKISPNKTFSGLISGIVGALVIVNIAKYFLPLQYEVEFSMLSLIIVGLSFAEQLSDLSVSCFKRKYRVKDTGNLIPGHGGVLDRFDGIIITAPMLLIITIISQNF